MKSNQPISALILIVFTSLLSVHILRAQTAQWIQQAGTSGITYGVSSDALLNCYATGQVGDPALFDSVTLASHFADVFIAKYSITGQLLWAKTAGGDLIDQGNEIATDASGNSYVAGAIQTNNVFPTVAFDSVTLTGNGSFDWFIAKYDADGNLLWVMNEGSTQGDFAFGVSLDAAGNILVCGEFNGTMAVSGTTLVSAGLSDVFIAKYHTDGSLVWIRQAGGSGNDEALSIATDAEGNFAIAGNFQNTAAFGSNSVTAAGLGDVFIAKYDSAGNNLWVRSGGGNVSFATDRAHSISSDASGNFYISGEYSGAATFDGLSVANTGTSGSDIFLAKYNGSGDIQWLHHGGGTSDDIAYGIAADVSGNVFVTGFADSGPGVVFDTISLVPFGNEYVFLAKYNESGNVLYVKQYAAGLGEDIHVLNNGCLYFGGGASPGNGYEFDTIDLVYVDRAAFTGEFCESVATITEAVINNYGDEVVAFPNPSQGAFTVSLSGFSKEVTLQCADVSGRIIYAIQLRSLSDHSSHQIQLPQVNSGLYFLKLSDESHSIVKTISVE